MSVTYSFFNIFGMRLEDERAFTKKGKQVEANGFGRRCSCSLDKTKALTQPYFEFKINSETMASIQ